MTRWKISYFIQRSANIYRRSCAERIKNLGESVKDTKVLLTRMDEIIVIPGFTYTCWNKHIVPKFATEELIQYFIVKPIHIFAEIIEIATVCKQQCFQYQYDFDQCYRLHLSQSIIIAIVWSVSINAFEAEWRIYWSVNWAITGWDHGLSPVRRQAIIWANTGILSIRPLGTNFNEISIEIQT